MGVFFFFFLQMFFFSLQLHKFGVVIVFSDGVRSNRILNGCCIKQSFDVAAGILLLQPDDFGAFFGVANNVFSCCRYYSLMLHMLILDVAKPFICCMQHVTHVAMGILLLHNRPMLVLDVECPGASKSLKSYEGLAAARGGPTWVFS